MIAYDTIERPGSSVSAVLLHPHPDMGGNRYHPIIDSLYRGLALGTLRLDFTSSSVDVAQAEVHQALDLVGDRAVVLMGYSFGADIALTITDARVLGWLLVAPPLSIVDPGIMAAATDPRPKLLAVPEHDQFSSPQRAGEVTAGWRSASVVTIPDADHFLVGRAPAVLDVAQHWLAGMAGEDGSNG